MVVLEKFYGTLTNDRMNGHFHGWFYLLCDNFMSNFYAIIILLLNSIVIIVVDYNFRHEARDIVRHAVGAGEQDAVLFTGQGTAGALRTLLRHLDLTTPTVVFVGPFEHHANLRPFREYGVKVKKHVFSTIVPNIFFFLQNSHY